MKVTTERLLRLEKFYINSQKIPVINFITELKSLTTLNNTELKHPTVRYSY